MKHGVAVIPSVDVQPPIPMDYSGELGWIQVAKGDWLLKARLWPRPMAYRVHREVGVEERVLPVGLDLFSIVCDLERLPPHDESGQLLLFPNLERFRRGSAEPMDAAEWLGMRRDVLDTLVDLPPGHWQELVFLDAGGDAAAELLLSNRPLARIVARRYELPHVHDELVDTPLDQLLALKQRDLLRLAGYPACKAMVKLLVQKLDVYSTSVQCLDALRRLLIEKPSSLSRLSHLPSIPYEFIELMRDNVFYDRMTPRLLLDISEDEYPGVEAGRVSVAFSYLVSVAESLGAPLPEMLRSKEHLFETLQDLLSIRHQQVWADYGERRYPAPPLRGVDVPGALRIVPISSIWDLLEEGRRQHNCLVHEDIFRQVFGGRYFVYQLLSPIRATISIEQKQGAWVLADVLAACNHEVPEKIRATVEDWIAGAFLRFEQEPSGL